MTLARAGGGEPEVTELTFDVVVNGQPTTVTLQSDAGVRDVIEPALKATGTMSLPQSEWEVRLTLGDVLHLDQPIRPYHGTRLWVNLRAGYVAAGAGDPGGEMRERHEEADTRRATGVADLAADTHGADGRNRCAEGRRSSAGASESRSIRDARQFLAFIGHGGLVDEAERQTARDIAVELTAAGAGDPGGEPHSCHKAPLKQETVALGDPGGEGPRGENEQAFKNGWMAREYMDGVYTADDAWREYVEHRRRFDAPAWADLAADGGLPESKAPVVPPRPGAGDALRRRLEAAHKELCEAVHRQWAGKHALKLSIPARPDHDTDLIIGSALCDALAALDAQQQATPAEGRDTLIGRIDKWMDGGSRPYQTVDLLREARAELDAQQQAAEDARMGHVRLDECSGAEATKGLPLYNRISKKIEELVHAKEEADHLRQAVGAEMDSLRAQVSAAKHRQAAAEYRAQRIVLDAELKQRAEQTEAQLREARALAEERGNAIARLGAAMAAPDEALARLRAALRGMMTAVAWRQDGSNRYPHIELGLLMSALPDAEAALAEAERPAGSQKEQKGDPMPTESLQEQLSRVELMASGDSTWDLSDNDCAALTAVVNILKSLGYYTGTPTTHAGSSTSDAGRPAVPER